ncbi:MAG: RNA methyltransferase [Bacteroidota bacterium]
MITTINHINTLERPELEPYRTLRRPIEHLEQGIFVAEGEKVIVRLLESSLTVRSVLLSQDWFDIYHPLIEKNLNMIDVFIGEKKLLETIVGHVLHQSIMGLATVPAHLLSDQFIQKTKDRSLIVLVDGITNAENMGVIVRNCVCFNVDALMVLPTSCDPYLRRSVRNSMGNIFQLPIIYIHNTRDELKRLKEKDFTIYGAHPHPKSFDIQNAMIEKKSCIVLGAEGHGISQEVLDLCDTFVKIPMREGVDSLNVASASAVMLWEVRKTMGKE